MAKQIQTYKTVDQEERASTFMLTVDYYLNDSVATDLSKRAQIKVEVAKTLTMTQADTAIEDAIKAAEGIA